MAGPLSVWLLIAIALYRDHLLVASSALFGLLVAFVSLWLASPSLPRQVTPLLLLDGYAYFYVGLILVSTMAVILLSYHYLEKHADYREEFYLLLTLAVLGSSILVASNHFISFFLGLEILSVSLYSLIAYFRDRRQSFEAGIKYLILASVSVAFLLFGMALVYADQGSLAFDDITWSQAIAGGAAQGGLLLAGLALLVVGIGFKLALVPFHLWAPDVYEGAPAPVAAFVATVSKGGMAALLLRLFAQADVMAQPSIFVVFGIVAVASMVIGNLLALLQSNLKRILAYSSIAHLGYLLVAFMASGDLGATAVTLYLVTYFVTTLAAFGIVTVLSPGQRDADRLDDYRGLFWRRPWLAAILTITMLSLAGIPLTAGFIGKFYVLAAGVGSELYWLVIILVVSSTIGLYYYLRVIVSMYLASPEEGEAAPTPALPLTGGVVLAVLAMVLIWLGVYPTPLLETIRLAIAGLL
ncbi:MAG: NADH-quinone oxidoreductase subunit N [Anaerolineae bacterium]